MATQAAIDRFLASPGLSDATRRAYGADLRDFAAWLREHELALDDVDVRVLAAYTSELGRARRGLAPTTIARRLSAVRSLVRHALGPSRARRSQLENDGRNAGAAAPARQRCAVRGAKAAPNTAAGALVSGST